MQFSVCTWRVFAVGTLAVFFSAGAMAISVSLSPPDPSVPVGTQIHFTTTITVKDAGAVWYRFRVREPGTQYKVIRDYGPLSALDWTLDQEGSFEVEVLARDLKSGDTAASSVMVQLVSAVTGDQPVIAPTANPLVFLYSAATCPAGNRMRVEFRGPDRVAHHTPYKACQPGLSMNFYLAGLIADTAYVARYRLDTGTGLVAGPPTDFTTGDLPPGLLTDTVITAAPATATEPILLAGPLFSSPVAYDLSGNVVWFAPPGDFTLTRPEPGGQFWGIAEDFSGDPILQIIRKYDLAGTTLQETNAARVNEQLLALGKRPISSFHHEVRTLPGGKIAALASVEQILSGVQGDGAVDVIGDMIIVFDGNLQVVWTWDTFDNLDVHRAAILGEKCIADATCPPHILAADGNDWTHGNSVQQTSDGNLIYSSRHQDWVIKISYDNGDGDGHIIWRLGKDGDFQYNSDDSYAWFSHQHDANFDFSDPTLLLVFDNGNTRYAVLGQGNSRGQVLQMDEQNRAVSFVLNADGGVYSLALGSAQKLSDGNYHFDFGYVAEPSGAYAYSIETDPSGNVIYDAKAGLPLYRSFRMADLYTPR